MKKASNLLNISNALYEDPEINRNRGRYILYILEKNLGEEIPHEKIKKYGFFGVPQSIITQFKKGYLILAEVTFLFACFYIANKNKKSNLKMENVLSCITNCWDEERTRTAEITMKHTLDNIEKYKSWIKKQKHNGKYYVKY
ncbi:hypothetical protein [Bacillus smithii]|uniref:hypothetical protein n=1 Tax=Bacillus smithii TaxID=1479 RepID=UPI0030C92CFE